jgi:hypothetical protein
MAPSWKIMADVTAGTLHLRTCDSLTNGFYLPPEPAEKSEHYSYRKSRAIFFQATDRTLNGLVGMVFRNDPKLTKTVPEKIRGREATDDQSELEGQWENIDNAGTHGAVFCKEVFIDAMRDGHAAILVDMPPPLPEGSTLEDERREGRRPYWVNYKADQIINWRVSVVNGQARLDLIVFRECSQEPDGEYGEKEVVRYRVLRRKLVDVETSPGVIGQEVQVVWELYREVKNETTGEKDVVLDPDTPGGATSLPEIPVAIIYGRKKGFLKSQPPLLDLALINIAHYQKYSDFSIYLHIASRPILWFKNRNTNVTVEVMSAYKAIDVGSDGHVDYAETTGAALGAASQDIKDLEERMSILGLSLLVKRTGAQTTATEERNDQIEESSDLETAARSMRDAIEQCLKFHAQYLNPKAASGGSVELGASLDALTLTPEEMTFWTNAVAAGLYSHETVWEVIGKGGKHPAGWTVEKEKQRLKESLKMKADMAEIAVRNFDRGGPPPDEEE